MAPTSNNVIGNTNPAGTRTAGLVAKAMKKLLGKKLTPIGNSPLMKALTQKQRQKLINSGSTDRSTAFDTGRESRSTVAHEIKRDTRAMKLLRARSLKKK